MTLPHISPDSLMEYETFGRALNIGPRDMDRHICEDVGFPKPVVVFVDGVGDGKMYFLRKEAESFLAYLKTQGKPMRQYQTRGHWIEGNPPPVMPDVSAIMNLSSRVEA